MTVRQEKIKKGLGDSGAFFMEGGKENLLLAPMNLLSEIIGFFLLH